MQSLTLSVPSPLGFLSRLTQRIRQRKTNLLIRKRTNRLGRRHRLKDFSPNFFDFGPAFDEMVAVEKQLTAIAESGDKILCGPWLSEVGFEVLYWIPFLKWFQTEFKIPPERFAILSRGGCKDWYQGISDEYHEVFDLFSLEEYREFSRRRLKQNKGGQKQTSISEFDEEARRRLEKKLGLKTLTFFHPQLMYNLLKPYWREIAGQDLIAERSVFKPKVSRETFPLDLPENYVAVKFYFSAPFPETEENRQFCENTIRRLSEKRPVVLLNTGLSMDDHAESLSESLVSKLPNVYSYAGKMTTQNNLAVQSYIVSRAQLFVGTYGGFSYLGPFYGVPSVSVFSRREKFLPMHLDVMNLALLSINAERAPEKRAEFLALDTEAFTEWEELF